MILIRMALACLAAMGATMVVCSMYVKPEGLGYGALALTTSFSVLLALISVMPMKD